MSVNITTLRRHPMLNPKSPYNPEPPEPEPEPHDLTPEELYGPEWELLY